MGLPSFLQEGTVLRVSGSAAVTKPVRPFANAYGILLANKTWLLPCISPYPLQTIKPLGLNLQ